MFKVNNRNTRTWCETCSELTIKIPERSLTYFTPYSSVSIVNFEQVNAGWGICRYVSSFSYIDFVKLSGKIEKVLKMKKNEECRR